MISNTVEISPLERSVIEILAYYHIFHHPLKAEEITARVSSKAQDHQSVLEVLSTFEFAGCITRKGDYYFLNDDPAIVKNREDGEIRAQKLMQVARKMAGVIYFFPFVRCVLVSGSLSKGTVPEDADIDYFIITKRNRLWIARTMLVMFKRLFLLGSKKYFCVNYFVDEDHLVIPDKNIFTATEVSTLIPIWGAEYYNKFMTANTWFRNIYPHVQTPRNRAKNPGLLKKFSQKILEPLFFHSLAESLDKFFMRRTYRRWKAQYNDGYSDEEFELAFRSRRGTSKNHSKNYQKKVLNTVEENVAKALSHLKMEVTNG